MLDFYCPEAKLAIELDGRSHEERAEYDATRTGHLHRYGIRVLRFTDDEVLMELDRVLDRIAHELGLDAQRPRSRRRATLELENPSPTPP